jgi:hypothetical protein
MYNVDRALYPRRVSSLVRPLTPEGFERKNVRHAPDQPWLAETTRYQVFTSECFSLTISTESDN